MTRFCWPLILLLAGCDQTLIVSADFPAPVVEKIPLRAGLVYPATLSGYRVTASTLDDVQWTIDIGTANVHMFTSLYAGLFAQTLTMTGFDAAIAKDLDVVILTDIQSFTFMVPLESGKAVYEATLRYTLTFQSPDGTILGIWAVSGYGQDDGTNQSAAAAMDDAIKLAMRDTAASIATEMRNAPGLATSAWQNNTLTHAGSVLKFAEQT